MRCVARYGRRYEGKVGGDDSIIATKKNETN